MSSAAEDKVESLLSVASDVDVVRKVLFTKSMEGQLHVVLIVFHQQNFDLSVASCLVSYGVRLRSGVRFFRRFQA